MSGRQGERRTEGGGCQEDRERGGLKEGECQEYRERGTLKEEDVRKTGKEEV